MVALTPLGGGYRSQQRDPFGRQKAGEIFVLCYGSGKGVITLVVGAFTAPGKDLDVYVSCVRWERFSPETKCCPLMKLPGRCLGSAGAPWKA